MSNEKNEPRRGGLGRGLAALIPTTPDPHVGVGDSAADIIFGNGSGNGKPSGTANRENPLLGGKARNSGLSGGHLGEGALRHGDENGSGRGDVSRETMPGDSRRATTQGGATEAPSEIGATYREIPLELIAPNPRQPREVFDEEPLNELAHSIREFGLMQPIVVRALQDKDRATALEQARERNTDAVQPEFEIIMGERRWRASQRAEQETIPAIVRETSDTDMLRDALLENIHRVQLNPLEEAAAYQQLLEEFDVTQQQLADKIGRSRPMITNMIRLLQLPVPVQRRVAAGVLSAGHARALLGVRTGRDDQEALANRIVAEGMSVRATEEAVTLLNRGQQPEPRRARNTIEQPERLNTWASRLADTFDTKVTATMGKRKGKIVIEFGDLDDFDRIMSMIENNDS
ncbi:ParB/RepB/Spo0J family partition protein [Corynebacterium sp. H113]|uniref:ParB/RepB/Spo0J family partition protein n=1 Tax=Corynebacterium sp. H113 TaxID=3133419 RepID=UPI003097C76E